MIIKGNLVVLQAGKTLSPGYVVVEGESITEVHATLPDTLSGKDIQEADIVCAGFIDLHNHGIGGAKEMLEYWLSDFSFKTLPNYGCTSVLASVTFPEDYSTTKQVCEKLNKIVGKVIEGQTVLEGYHSEGPIVNDCGGLPHSHGDSMPMEEFDAVLKMMGKGLKVMTISPSSEAKVNYARLKALLNHGGIPALGHDKNAREEEIIGALRVCAAHNPPVIPHITHLCNVSSFHHRLPSLVNFGMVEEYPNEEQYKDLIVPTIEVIGDLVHVSSMTIATLLKTRSPSQIAFCTDAVLDCNAHDDMSFSGHRCELKEIQPGRKAVVLKATGTITGSCGNMLQMLQNLVRVLRVPVPTAVEMLSETPATIARINNKVGTISVGKRADILLLDSNLNLKKTFIGGKVAFST